MENFNRKNHWNSIYQTKQLNEVSWYQPVPDNSIVLIQQHNIPANAKIIDVGGGDSFFVDYLVNNGFRDVTVLDISQEAIERARQRLGNKADDIHWVVTDVVDFEPEGSYDFWHDRAAFHFLTEEEDIAQYVKLVAKHVKPGGVMVIGTFSEQGPKKCSGIDIRQYSETSMTECFKLNFEKINCVSADHKTPFDTIQNFVFCSFRKI